MSANEIMDKALATLSCEASRRPAKSGLDTYVSWFEVMGQEALLASNKAQRTEHMMQVDLYSKAPLHDLQAQVIALLKAAGVIVSSIGPDDYESDMGYNHLPITCRINTKGGLENA